jgi:ribulose-bisphosphate carboxylase large chain
MGAAAGVMALQQAWHAAVKGMSIEEAAAQYPEFAESVKQFGKKI